MLWNIIDRRKRPYRWQQVSAIIEASDHDNSCDDADQVENTSDVVMYEERRDILSNDAVRWAEQAPGMVTLYLYNKGDGI